MALTDSTSHHSTTPHADDRLTPDPTAARAKGRSAAARHGPLDDPARALVCLCWALVVAVALWIGGRSFLPLAVLEGWAYDLRTVTLPGPDRPAGRDVLLVQIDDASLRHQPWRDPVDRGLVADLIDRAAALGARAVGVAMTFPDLRPVTEPANSTATDPAADLLLTAGDDALIRTVRDASLPVVIGIDPRGGTLQTRLLALTIGGRIDPDRDPADDAARTLPGPATADAPPHMMRELARIVRAAPPDQPVLHRFGSPLPVLSATALTADNRARIDGRVVVIEPARAGRLDPRFPTALSITGTDGLTRGALIGAGLAQLMANDRPTLPASWQVALLLLGSALIGLVAGGCAWPAAARLAVGIVLTLAFGAGAVALYGVAGLAIPIAGPVLAFWLTGIGAYWVVDQRRIGLERRLRAAYGGQLDGPLLRTALTLSSGVGDRGPAGRRSPVGGPAGGAPAGGRLSDGRLSGGMAVGQRLPAATVLSVDVGLVTDAADWLEPGAFADAVARHRRFVRRAVVAAGGIVLQADGVHMTALFGGIGPQPDHAVAALRCLLALRADTADGPSAALGPVRAVADSGALTLLLSDDPCGTGLSVEGAPAATSRRLLAVADRLGSPLCATAATVSTAFASGEDDVALRPVAELRAGTGDDTLISLFETIPKRMVATQETQAYFAAFRRMRDLDPETPYLFRALHDRSPDDPLIAAHLARLTSGHAGSVVDLA